MPNGFRRLAKQVQKRLLIDAVCGQPFLEQESSVNGSQSATREAPLCEFGINRDTDRRVIGRSSSSDPFG